MTGAVGDLQSTEEERETMIKEKDTEKQRERERDREREGEREGERE